MHTDIKNPSVIYTLDGTLEMDFLVPLSNDGLFSSHLHLTIT